MAQVPPNMGWVSTTLAAWKHLMAHKLAGQLNFPLALFYDAEDRYLVLPAFGQTSCCAGTPGLFYFITFIFLFLYASLSEDSYLSWALLRGKSTTKHKLRDGEWFIASSIAPLFLAGAEHSEKFTPPLLSCKIQALCRTPKRSHWLKELVLGILSVPDWKAANIAWWLM